jgi:hypothetical protein
MRKVAHFFSIAVSLLIVAVAPAPNLAQTSSGSSTPATNISNDYNYFLKNVDSKQVVNDLRNGQWTTTTTDPTTNTTTTTTEALPTGKMGFGNVKISLALAQESLRQQNIMQPTSEQLHTALVGGQMVPGDSTTTTILQMRSEGMGWGQIAQKYDVKLGQLMSGKQPASTATTSTTTSATTSRGITTASEKSSTTVTGKGNGKSFSGSESQGKGIVSASGRSSGTSSSSISHGGRGIVSGSGRSMGHTSGIVTGGGSGHQYGASGGGHGNSGGHGKGAK